MMCLKFINTKIMTNSKNCSIIYILLYDVEDSPVSTNFYYYYFFNGIAVNTF